MVSQASLSRAMSARKTRSVGAKDTAVDKNANSTSTKLASNSVSPYRSSIPSFYSESAYVLAHIMNHNCRTSDHSPSSSTELPCLVNFHSANCQPPITKAKLRELDLDNLFENLLLRHDLNFDPNIQYRPTIHGLRGEIRLKEAVEYWNAMGTELAGCFVDGGNGCCCWTAALSQHKAQNPVRKTFKRLPQMFDTIRDILRSLLPDTESSGVDARLDTHLLVQQLENGACDFIALSEWLGALLRRYCSPERKSLIDEMTTQIESGVQRGHTGDLLAGLMQTFTIIEVMKLDQTNHEIRTQRATMVDATVGFEHQKFLREIAEGWDVSQARTWFVNERRAKHQPSGIMILGPAITKLVVTNSNRLPPTLTLDYIRIRILQKDFEDLMYQAACRWTLEEVLSSLNWQRPIPQPCYDSLFARVCVITSAEESRRSPQRLTEDVALEIVRTAYELCHISTLPSTKDLEFAESNLEYSSDVSTSVYQDLHSYMAEDLQDLVDEEVRTTKDLTPMQLANRYLPDALARPSPSSVTEQSRIQLLAQQISHISVLHWRVWGPLLYEQPDQPGDA